MKLTLITALVAVATLAAAQVEAKPALNGISINGTAGNGLVQNGYKLRGSLQATGGERHGTSGMIITTITLPDGTQIELN